MDIPNTRKAALQRADQLRRSAIAHLLSPGGDYRPRAATMELGQIIETFPRLERHPIVLEARVATILARPKLRARQAQQPFYYLFRAMLEAGTPERFQQFEQMLKYACAGTDRLDTLHFHRAFHEMDHDEVWSVVGDSIAQLQDLGFEVFLNSGTLLGVVRDGKLIPHDDDVDLALVFEADSQTEAAQKWREITDLLLSKDLLSSRKPRNPAMRKLKANGPCNIDLFPAWRQPDPDGDKLFVYPYCCGDLNADHVLPTQRCPITGLPIPQNAPDLLAANYGEGWRTPDPSYSFPWNWANKRFQEFRESLNITD